MSSRTFPGKTPELLRLADHMTYGLMMHGPWVGLDGTQEEELRVVSQRLREAETFVDAARNAKTLALKKVIVNDRVMKTWLCKARLVVMLAIGRRWSEAWIHTGFADRCTNIPRQLDARISLARSLVSFFARHPEFGVPFADVTAVRGRAVHDRVVQSREMLQLMAKDFDETKEQRDAARKALYDSMRSLLHGLSRRIEPSDRRWLDFGLKPKKGKSFHGLGPAGKLALNPILFVPAPASASHKSAAA